MGYSVVTLKKEQVETLLNKGTVYTVRSLHARTNAVARVRCNRRFVAVVSLRYVGRICRSRIGGRLYVVTNDKTIYLDEFAKESGFKSEDEWVRFAETLYRKYSRNVCLVRLTLIKRIPLRKPPLC